MLTIITLLSVYDTYLKMQYQSCVSAKPGNVVDRRICNFIELQRYAFFMTDYHCRYIAAIFRLGYFMNIKLLEMQKPVIILWA